MPKQSRKQRKIQTEKKRNKLKNQGYSAKEVKHLPKDKLQKAVDVNIPQSKAKSLDNAVKIADRREKDRIRAQQRRDKLRSERLAKLEIISDIVGVADPTELNKITAKKLDKIKIEDLKSGMYKRTDFREAIPIEKVPYSDFDFDKVYKVPDGKKLHFAFRSLNGDTDIAKELAKYSQYSNEYLLGCLREIKGMPRTRSQEVEGSKGRNVGSNGQPGEAIIQMGSQLSLNEKYQDEYNANRRSITYDKLRSKVAKQKNIPYQHSAIDYYWQTISQADENGKAKAYTEITPRKLLIIGNALLWNVTEDERDGLYKMFYAVSCDVIPDMKKILP